MIDVATSLPSTRGISVGAARRLSLHAWDPGRRLWRAAVDDAAVRGLRERRGDERALPPAARARPDRPLDGVRPADAARARLGRPACARRGGAHGRRDRLARRHAPAVRRDPARRGLDLDDDQRACGGAPAAVRARRRRAGRRSRGAERNDPERRAEGVRGAWELHLPAATLDAAHRRRLPVLPRARAALQRDLDLGLPHPRGGLERGAGARLHARERHRVRRGGRRGRARRG